ncbi:MAG TPA: RNA methyltransferase, partial [Firmicutes bacterium]|nr:RNA methyltransferase [Bacillota bacterium]
AKAYYQLKPEKGVGLIIGNEGQGISQAIVEIAKEKVYIPIDKRSESLNAAIAAGVLLFYLKEHLG